MGKQDVYTRDELARKIRGLLMAFYYSGMVDKRNANLLVGALAFARAMGGACGIDVEHIKDDIDADSAVFAYARFAMEDASQ